MTPHRLGRAVRNHTDLQAIQWATAILILAAIPCIVWLWRWAL